VEPKILNGEYKKKYIAIFQIVRFITALLLFWALAEHPYGFYQFLRIIVCGVSLYSLLTSLQVDKKFWIWVFGVLTILFNPIFPIHLTREIWIIFDVVAGLVYILSIFIFKHYYFG